MTSPVSSSASRRLRRWKTGVARAQRVSLILTQLAQFEGRFEILLLMLVKEIKGLAGVLGANRRVVPTIPIFF